MTQNIGIAGAGLMGRMLAWQLAEAGHTVTLFDRDNIEGGSAAGFTAAGMLTPYAEAESAEPLIYQLGMRSLSLWPELVKHLPKPVRFHQRGSIVVAHPNDHADLLQFSENVKHKLSPNSEQFKFIHSDDIQQLEPELSHEFNTAISLPEEAWVSAEDVMSASADYALELGVKWKTQTPVESVQANLIKTNNQTYAFDLAIDTRGTGAKQELKEVRGVRGELIWLQAPDVNITRLVRLMHPRYRIYLVPLMRDDLYIVGATQIESDDHSPISVRSCLELLSAVYSLNSGFAEARLIKTQTNCRPALIDNLPRIDTTDGLIRVNGLFRHGYLLAPAIAEHVLSWIKSAPEHQPHATNILDLLITS